MIKKKSGRYGHKRAKEEQPMRDINWGISFDITINGKEASFSDLTESEQKKILDDLAEDFYYGTFIGEEDEEDC